MSVETGLERELADFVAFEAALLDAAGTTNGWRCSPKTATIGCRCKGRGKPIRSAITRSPTRTACCCSFASSG